MTENDPIIAPLPQTYLDDDIVQIHSQSLGYLLGRAHLLFRQRIIKALEGTGLNMGQVLILASLRAQSQLHRESDLTQTRLTQITGIEKSSLVLFLDALERDGWVERRRHPTDRRAYIVHLTGPGAERFNQVGQRLHENETECLAAFEDAERKQMSGLLLRLIQQMQPLEQAADSATGRYSATG